MMDFFHCSGNSSFHVELTSLRIWIVLPPALINSAVIESIPVDLCLFSFSVAISTSKALVVLLHFGMPNIINPMNIQQLREMIPPPSQNLVGVYNQITLLMLYYITSRLATLVKVLDALTKVSDILVLTVCFKFINFNFPTFPLFVPEMSDTVFQLPTHLAS